MLDASVTEQGRIVFMKGRVTGESGKIYWVNKERGVGGSPRMKERIVAVS